MPHGDYTHNFRWVGCISTPISTVGHIPFVVLVIYGTAIEEFVGRKIEYLCPGQVSAFCQANSLGLVDLPPRLSAQMAATSLRFLRSSTQSSLAFSAGC